jgi:ABC-type lipoprotein export system ATPase subunit
VFQSFHLVEELNGTENVTLPAGLRGAPAGGKRRARQLIGRAQAGRRRRPPSALALRGRAAAVRDRTRLVNDPGLVLADEPTGNLDADNGAAVLPLLRHRTGRAVMIVTHEPEAAAIADRVLRLQEGTLHADAAKPRGPQSRP